MAAIMLLAGGCGERLPAYRYRLTVEVETPEGVRTGSSVIEVRTSKGLGFPGPEAGQFSSSARGEAVTVPLGRRGVLFALLRSPLGQSSATSYASALLPNPPASGSDSAAARANILALKAAAGSARLDPSDYPTLVRFDDLRRPDSVRIVDPADLSGSFGSGVRLIDISVEVTDDPVTTGISRLFPWWDKYLDRHFDGSSTVSDGTPGEPAGYLSSGSFSSEAGKR